MNKNGKIEKYDVWDIAPDEMKLLAFPIVVQALYNAMISLEAYHETGGYSITGKEMNLTMWDIRNVHKMLFRMGVKSTFTKKVHADGYVTLKHITNDVWESLLFAFKHEIESRKEKWTLENSTKEKIEIIDLKKKIKDLEVMLHIKTKNETEESDEEV